MAVKELRISEKEVLTVDEVCIYTGLTKRTIYQLTKSGKLRSHKPSGKQIFIEKQALIDWMTGK